jgi:hypothetical protein
VTRPRSAVLPTLLRVVPFLTLALAAAASPGCCGIDRAEGPRSRSFLVRTLAARTSEDARSTADTVTMAHCAVRESLRSSARDLGGTCTLYAGAR